MTNRNNSSDWKKISFNTEFERFGLNRSSAPYDVCSVVIKEKQNLKNLKVKKIRVFGICPICKQNVLSKNLERHKRKVHDPLSKIKQNESPIKKK